MLEVDIPMKPKYKDLQHIRRSLKNGGKVVVLNTGALITAEAEAMLQALHSRSVGGVDTHLTKLAQKGAKNFMDEYYIGYGDKSIGDCGTTTIFIEGVSMLAAKAIQDSMLYNGQESSTRFIDFSAQPFLNPTKSEKGSELLESLRKFYLYGLSFMKDALEKQHPFNALTEPDEKKWRKAINARAFDVMRSFLPAGAVTNLSWHTELRHAADHLLRLRNHPLKEVREIAVTIHSALDEMHPSSFKQKFNETHESYVSRWMNESYYFNKSPFYAGYFTDVRLEMNEIDETIFEKYKNIFSKRPKRAEPPKWSAECGVMRFSFLLDFGSFRDIQRHRSLIQRMPLLTDDHEFHPWYLAEMPEELQKQAIGFLARYKQSLAEFKLPPPIKQYYIPMGYCVTCKITGDLPALIWLVELRSGKAVHPTLRSVARHIGKIMQNQLGDDFKLYIDETENSFNIKRGGHDITEKP